MVQRVLNDWMSVSNAYPAPPMEEVDLVDVLRAVADPTRLQILRVLADGEPHSKGTSEWGVELQKSALAYHFKTLREAGVTLTLVNGRTHQIQLRRTELDSRFPGLIDSLIAAS